jgi:hypothetical protein
MQRMKVQIGQSLSRSTAKPLKKAMLLPNTIWQAQSANASVTANTSSTTREFPMGWVIMQVTYQ